MPVFEYKALDRRGRKKTGIIDGESLVFARTKLREKGIYPTTMVEVGSEGSGGGNGSDSSLAGRFLFGRISNGELAMVTRQLATLLSAGFPLISAVSSLVVQTRSKPLKKVLSKIKGSIEEGKSFAESLAMYPSLFSAIYVNMIRAGESSGTLELVLERLADITEKREETKKKIQSALAYPLLMALVGSLVLLFLLAYIVPGIISIFSDMNQTLPGPTLFLIAISSFLKRFWWVVILVPVVCGVALYVMAKNERGAYLIDKFLFLTPKLGDLLKKISAARFSRILSSLLANGVPMMTALSISRATAGNRVISAIISRVSRQVEQGGELGVSLGAERVFPTLAVEMIKIGEKSGQLERMLEKTADLYEREVEGSVTTMTALLEPLIILVMGVVVGFIVLSVCLPIFEMNQLVK
ncbi:MAG: type II secretion system inner membrane protein GspF [Desulfobacterium sp.]|jgi:general secretion pathway protein F|nr:type II secretion system inner membrane protein GspF [Desulfobacterium sp.]